MLSRYCSAVVLGCLIAMPLSAQTVRFDTNVGTFDMVLNPTGNPNLQGHVDNLLTYVEGGFYDNLVLNRADDRNSTDGNDGNRQDDFVLQMGRFRTNSFVAPDSSSDFTDNRSLGFATVNVDEDQDGTVDYDTTGLSNTRGQVSLALSGTDSNSGASEFFINLGDNSFLDAQPGGGAADFVPFAEIVDMATIDLIFGLDNRNLYGGSFTDVPLLDNNHLVFVERAFVMETTDDAIAAAAMSGGMIANSSAALQANSVPEPSTLLLAFGALMLSCMKKPKRIG